MRTLHLTLKKKWFDMIESGEKTEEYREIKSYWCDRFTWHEHHERITCFNSLCDEIYADSERTYQTGVLKQWWDVVEFRNGYSKNARKMTLEFKGLGFGKGREEWGAAPMENYFIIKLGKKL